MSHEKRKRDGRFASDSDGRMEDEEPRICGCANRRVLLPRAREREKTLVTGTEKNSVVWCWCGFGSTLTETLMKNELVVPLAEVAAQRGL